MVASKQSEKVLTPKKQRLSLVDASGFIFRAYHALPPLTSASGVPTGAVYGFCNMLYKLLEEDQPDYLAVVFDTGKPSFRQALYAEYKANRPPAPEDLLPQFGWIDRIVRAFNIPLLRREGFEADDLIATLATRASAAGLEVTIVSSDKDLMQLACDAVELWDTMKNRRYGVAEVGERYGVSPAQLGDWLALCGDSIDNIPGVPGIGPKTATKLLVEHGDLEGVLAAADKVRGRKLQENLLRYAEQARLSRKLVELERQVPLSERLEDFHRREPDDEQLREIFQELGFSRLVQRLAPQSDIDRGLYRTVYTVEELRRCLEAVRAAGRVALDLETTSLDATRAQIVGVSLSWASAQACYIPAGHVYLGMPKQLRLATVLSELEPLLTDPTLPKYGQNHKYDQIVLRRAGVEVRGFAEDPMLISYALDPSRNQHGLDALAAEYLNHAMISYKEVTRGCKGFEEVTLEQATAYAAEDAEVTFRLVELLRPRLAAEPDLERLYLELELPLAGILGEMELRGVALQTTQLSAMSQELAGKLAELEQAVQAEAGWPVNLNSPKQLQRLLFDELGLAAGRKTKTGLSTDADVLADLAIEHPIAARIDEYRTLAKLKSGYVDSLPLLVNPDTGRVHTNYNQAVAATGRLSSSDPNLQNIPIRSELGRRIRAAFVAPPGKLLLSADYSQIELRILAHLARDPVLLEAFAAGQDVHQRTASEVFGVAPEQVSAEQRRVAKAVNFGVIYGQTDWGLSRQLRILRAEAASYIQSYFARHAGVQTFMEQTIARARETRSVRTLLGRRRPVPDITSSKRTARLYAERVARNTPIQGTAADLMKLAMIQVHEALDREQLDAPMILTVHDELVFEVQRQQLETVRVLVTQVMSQVMALDVPLRVDTGAGENWAEAHG